MPTLNEVKYTALEPLAAGKPATLNELEHLYLTTGGVPEGGTPVSYTHLTLPTMLAQCRSRWSPYH